MTITRIHVSKVHEWNSAGHIFSALIMFTLVNIIYPVVIILTVIAKLANFKE